jgi:hypothetical protein
MLGPSLVMRIISKFDTSHRSCWKLNIEAETAATKNVVKGPRIWSDYRLYPCWLQAPNASLAGLAVQGMIPMLKTVSAGTRYFNSKLERAFSS